MKKFNFDDLLATVFGCLILAGFTFTLAGWVLWSAKWVLTLVGVM